VKVSDIVGVRKPVVTVTSTSRLGEVSRTMRMAGVGAAVVSAGPDRLAGVITEREIVHAVGLGGPAAVNLSAGEAMSSPVPTCAPTDFVPDVMHRMLSHRIRHLALVEDGHLVGMVSTGDVMKALLDRMEMEANVLRDMYLTARSQ
jgi:CBS domain-containing protein